MKRQANITVDRKSLQAGTISKVGRPGVATDLVKLRHHYMRVCNIMSPTKSQSHQIKYE